MCHTGRTSIQNNIICDKAQLFGAQKLALKCRSPQAYQDVSMLLVRHDSPVARSSVWDQIKMKELYATFRPLAGKNSCYRIEASHETLLKKIIFSLIKLERK